ncbi:MAG: hypothetical protein AB7U73_11360 [Pirellulales bacterium]
MKRYRWWILGSLVAVPVLGCCGFFGYCLAVVWPSYNEAKSQYAAAHADQLVAEATALIDSAKGTGQHDFDVHGPLSPAIASLHPLRLEIAKAQDLVALHIQIQAGFNYQGLYVIVDPGKSGAQIKHSKFRSRNLHERIVEYRGGG